MSIDERANGRLDDELYERVGRPLEADHWGEFLAVTDDGRFIVGPDDVTVSQKAYEDFQGAFLHIYNVGERVVGRIR